MITSREHKQRGQAEPLVERASSDGLRRRLVELGHTEEGRVAEFGAIVVAGFLAAVVLLYAFAWLANEVLDQETHALDVATLTLLRRFSSPELTSAAQVVSAMGSQVVFALGGLLVVVFIWQRRWGAAITLLLVTGGAQVLNDFLKELIHRTRP